MYDVQQTEWQEEIKLLCDTYIWKETKYAKTKSSGSGILKANLPISAAKEVNSCHKKRLFGAGFWLLEADSRFCLWFFIPSSQIIFGGLGAHT